MDPAKEDKFLKIREKFNEKVQKLPGVQVWTRPCMRSQRSFSSKIFFTSPQETAQFRAVLNSSFVPPAESVYVAMTQVWASPSLRVLNALSKKKL